MSSARRSERVQALLVNGGLLLLAVGAQAEGVRRRVVVGELADRGVLDVVLDVVVAVVAQAVWGMARSLCPDTPRRVLVLVAADVMLLIV